MGANNGKQGGHKNVVTPELIAQSSAPLQTAFASLQMVQDGMRDLGFFDVTASEDLAHLALDAKISIQDAIIVLDNVSNFSRLIKGTVITKKTNKNLVEVVGEILELFRVKFERMEVQVILDYEGVENVDVLADNHQIFKLIRNMLINGVKVSKLEKKVHIHFSVVKSPDTPWEYDSDNHKSLRDIASDSTDFLRIAVIDTGNGMAEVRLLCNDNT